MEHNGWTNCIWRASSLQNFTSQIELATFTSNSNSLQISNFKATPIQKEIHYIKNIMKISIYKTVSVELRQGSLFNLAPPPSAFNRGERLGGG